MASSKGSAFAQGFASTFVPIYTARIEAEQKKELDTIKIGAQAWLDQEEEYKTAKQKEEALWSQAEAIVSTESAIPKNATATIFNMLKAGRTTDSIIKDVRTKGSKFNAVEQPKPESIVEPVTTEEAPTLDIDNQTDEMLQQESAIETDARPDKPVFAGQKSFLNRGTTGSENEEPKGDKEEKKEDPNNPFTQYRSEIQEYLGKDDDYFNQVLGGYQAPERQTNYTFTPGASDKEREFTTPKAFGLYLLTNSQEFMAGTDAEKQDKLLEFNKSYEKENNGSSTLTASRYASLYAENKKNLSSDDPDAKKKAEDWFLNEKPSLEAALTAAATLTEKPSDKPRFNVMYTKTDENGNSVTLQGEGEKIFGDDGNLTGFKLLGSGEVLPPNEVRNVITLDDRKARAKAIAEASTVYPKVEQANIAATVAVENFMALDRMAYDNPEILTTLVGKGSALGQSFVVEMSSIVDLLGGLQEQDPNANKESLLDAMNAKVTELIDDKKISKKTGNAYKEFNAAIIRSVFASGRALGQEGNGFSNQDYRVISSSLKNANSYEAFSNNLRKFSTELYSGWNATAIQAQNNPIIRKAYTIPGARELLQDSIMGPEDFYTKGAGKDSNHIYEWSKGKARSPLNSQLYEEADQNLVDRFQMPEEYIGSKVIMYIDTDEQGNATGSYSFERY